VVESDGGSIGEEPRLPIRVEHFWAQMLFAAEGAARNLQESWKRPVRHNKKLERLALWHTVNLELDCENALSLDASPPVLPLSASDGPPEVRYDVDAAIRLVPRLIPFTDFDRARLRALPDRSFDDWGEAMAEREPGLIAGWHRWLWANSPNEPYLAGDYGKASELAVAASQLANGVNVILGWDA
jgi:hypothetical protein